MRLYHQGQLAGKRIRVPVQLCRVQEESPDDATAAFYDRILALTNEDVFHAGQWTLLPSRSAGDDSFNTIIVYQWKTNRDWRLIVVNLSAMVAQAYIPLNGQLEIDPHRFSVYTLYDQFNDQVYEGRQEDLMQNGLYVRLDPMGCHIFSMEDGAVKNRKRES
jgi:hypothetical protein